MQPTHPISPHSDSHQISRSFVRSLLKAQSLDDKIILARSALYQRHLNSTYRIHRCQTDPSPKKQLKMYKAVSISIESPSLAVGQESAPIQTAISYLKQTSGTQTEPTVSDENTYISSFDVIELGSSTASFQAQSERKGLEIGETCCTFDINDSCRSGSLKQSYILEGQFQVSQNQSLKKEIDRLQLEMARMDQQKNRWKKKAMKQDKKVLQACKQMKRFEAAMQGGAQ